MNNKAFTLTEILIVVILLGILAAFALPNYGKSLDKSIEKDAIIQLTTIHSASTIYRARTGAYWDDGGGGVGVAALNAGLGINVVESDPNITIKYDRTTATAYNATAKYTGGSTFTVKVNEGPIVKNTNPFCQVGPCPSLP